ncbi:G-protein coupled receptor 35-like [Tachysurus vachellii]|uniref:G-protein coupled receptor 35-like n=1 Tax=Tachysurus vachellii TaxID=175792 RepID=UPI00296B4849|nr:G-protein coupled receptor 35-like [Tachysurus vachellii]
MNSSIHTEEEKEHIIKLSFVISIHVLNYLLGLPLNSCVMVLLLDRRRRLDPCDVFTLNQAAVEIFLLLLAPFHVLCNIKVELCFNKVVGFVIGVGMLVRSLLQCAVCQERYVAIVHPLTYRKFTALRYRAAICGVTWVSGLASGVVCMFTFPFLPYKAILVYTIVMLSINIFNCMSILRTLRHSAPGKRNADTGTGDGIKKRAFHVVLVNLLTFLVQNIPIFVVFFMHDTLSMMDFSLALAVTLAINITVGFMSPAFVLHKAGKLSLLKSPCF